MFGFFNGFGSNIASGAGGAISGAFIMNLINKFSMKKKDMKIEDLIHRLGGKITDEEMEKALNKVIILQTMAYRDSTLCDKEKLYIIQYIIENQYIPADLKVDLIAKLDVSIETNPIDYIESFKTKRKHKHTFSSMEEKYGFSKILYDLASEDGIIDDKEKKYLKLVCEACDLPTDKLNI